MVDWLEIREEDEFLISGTVSKDEFEAETTPLNPKSLFDRRLKTVIRQMLEEEEEEDEIHVEALVKRQRSE
jgi:hypothetical protein